jgi:hypothetical protein
MSRAHILNAGVVACRLSTDPTVVIRDGRIIIRSRDRTTDAPDFVVPFTRNALELAWLLCEAVDLLDGK